MKKILLVVGFCGLILLTVFLLINRSDRETEEPVVPVTPLPIADESSGIKVVTPSGAVVDIADPRRTGKMADQGLGLWHMEGNHENPDSGYSIVYNDGNKSFAIDIWKEPLSASREAASEYLLDLLQISEEEACLLGVYVGVTADINEDLSGENLGLSFCPSAIPI